MSQTPKEEFHRLMVEMFEMIGEWNIAEGDYLKVAELFKQLNINLNRFTEIRQVVITNAYYRRHISRVTSQQQVRLTEAEKRCSSNYSCCNCGRYVHNDYQDKHLDSQVHYQGRRNRKYAGKGLPDNTINERIDREVCLYKFAMKHISKQVIIRENAIDDFDPLLIL